jgi:hypothetical protein
MIDLWICFGRRPMAVDAIALEHILSDFSSKQSHNTTQKSNNN